MAGVGTGSLDLHHPQRGEQCFSLGWSVVVLVLQGISRAPHPLRQYRPRRLALAYGAGSFGGALLIAAAGLGWQRLAATSHQVRAGLLRPANTLEALHSGSDSDYATWLVTGTAALALSWAPPSINSPTRRCSFSMSGGGQRVWLGHGRESDPHGCACAAA